MNTFEKKLELKSPSPEKFYKVLERLRKYQATKTEDDPEEQEGWIYDLPKNKDKRLEVGDYNYYDFAVRGNFANVFLLELGMLIENIPDSQANKEIRQQLKDLEQDIRAIYSQTDDDGNRTMRTEQEMARVKEIVQEVTELAQDIVFEQVAVNV